MRLRWTPSAAADLEEISNHLRDQLPHLRQSTLQKIYREIQALKTFPNIGRQGLEPNTRELSFTPLPYIAVYRISNNSIEILRIYHGAQLYR